MCSPFSLILGLLAWLTCMPPGSNFSASLSLPVLSCQRLHLRSSSTCSACGEEGTTDKRGSPSSSSLPGPECTGWGCLFSCSYLVLIGPEVKSSYSHSVLYSSTDVASFYPVSHMHFMRCHFSFSGLKTT